MKKTIILLFYFSLLPFHSAHSQWYQQTIPVTKPVTGIEFIDSLKGWACTDAGIQFDSAYILNTTNGGLSWNVQFRGGTLAFYGISIVNDTIGYTCGGTGVGKVYKTTNGGLNWNMIVSFGTGSFSDIVFVNKDSGYISGNVTAEIYTTTNGGANWINVTSGIGQQVARLFFLSYTTGWCGAQFFLYKTTNAGLSWFLNGNFSEQIRAIFFLNENTGWLGMTNDKIYFTSNAGTNWIPQPNPGYGGTTTDFYFEDNQTGWGGNRSIYIYKTTNGGQLWGYQRDTSASFRVSFFDNLKGWSGDAGISHTSNGGGPIYYVGIVSNHNNIPERHMLYQNYPNPFNSQTNIRFSINKPSYVKLKIYDILGKEKTLWESAGLLGAGTHELNFDAQNYSSGVYFYQLTVSNERASIVYKETRKMILVK